MKRYLLIILLVTAVIGSGCRKSEALGDTTEDTMHFLAGINDREDNWGVRPTRGIPLDNTTIRQFSAFCFNTGRTMWTSAYATAMPNKMCDVLVTRNGNEWIYDSPVKWEGGDGSYFTFFGYSPRATGVYLEPDSPLGNNLELTTTVATAGVPVLKFTTFDYVPMQVDLLVAKPIYNTYPVKTVKMEFAHALSQIRFNAWSVQDFVRVKSISISNVQYSATMKLDGTCTPDMAVKTFTLSEINRTISTDETRMTDLTAGGNAFMLVPQDLTSNTTAMIVITFVANGVEVTTKPYTIKDNWEKGNSYTYTIQLGGTVTEEMGVTEVTVSDWVVDSQEDINTGGGAAEQI